MIRLKSIALIAALSLSAPTSARADVDPSELYEIKSKLEDAVVSKYKSRISTRLPAGTFSVGAQVTLTVGKQFVDVAEPKAEKRNNPDPIDLSGGFGFGLMPATQEPTAAPVRSQKVMKDRVQISKVEVFVGLSSNLETKDKESFKEWLTQNVESEFGRIGTAGVSEVAIAPAKALDSGKDKPSHESPQPEFSFGNFQILIGLTILGLFAMLTALIAKFVPSRDIQSQIASAQKLEELRAAAMLEQAAASSGRPKKDKETSERSHSPQQSSLNAGDLFESYRVGQSKVAFLAMALQGRLEQITDLWLDEGDDGRRKLASVLDCVLGQIGKSQLEKNGVQGLTLEWPAPERLKTDKTLAAVFKSFASLSLEEKSHYLERAYWDLVSAQIIGDSAIKQRFANLVQLTPIELQKVLGTQNKRMRSLAVLNLPPDKLAQIIGGLPYEEKKALLDQAFENPKIKEDELDVVDQSLNLMIKQDLSKNNGEIEFPSLVPNFLAALTATEELNLVREMSLKRPDSADYLRISYPALAFVGEWPQDKLKLLFKGARPQEISALLQIMPEAKNDVLTALPSRTRDMIKQDSGGKAITDDELNQHLENIRGRIFDLVEDGEVEVAQIFAPKDAAPTGVAA